MQLLVSGLSDATQCWRASRQLERSSFETTTMDDAEAHMYVDRYSHQLFHWLTRYLLSQSAPLHDAMPTDSLPRFVLPAEILLLVFEAAQLVWPTQNYKKNMFLLPDYTSAYHLGWILLTHVCRSWREVGL